MISAHAALGNGPRAFQLVDIVWAGVMGKHRGASRGSSISVVLVGVGLQYVFDSLE